FPPHNQGTEEEDAETLSGGKKEGSFYQLPDPLVSVSS
ncbi:unnamed protein product, partial [marine sediment metagenome]